VTQLLVVSGALAALILYRPMRTLALVVLAIIMISLLMASGARSEQVEMVQCSIRFNRDYNWTQFLSRGYCSLLEQGTDMTNGIDPGTVEECKRHIYGNLVVIRDYSTPNWLCNSIYISKRNERRFKH
jgi:hypothetical protein